MVEQHGILTLALFVVLVFSIFRWFVEYICINKALTKNHSTHDHPSSHFARYGEASREEALSKQTVSFWTQFRVSSWNMLGPMVPWWKKHIMVTSEVLLNISGGWGGACPSWRTDCFKLGIWGIFWSCELSTHTKSLFLRIASYEEVKSNLQIFFVGKRLMDTNTSVWWD